MPKAILSTTAPFGYEIDTDRFLAAFKALGCTSIQFFRNPEKEPTVKEVLAAAGRAGMAIDSIHGLFGPHLDPSSPDVAQRANCLKVYEEEARLALELGGPMVIVHPCRSSPQREGAPPEWLPLDEARRQQQARWPHLNDFLRRLAEVGHRLSVTFLIENLMLDCPLGHDPVQLAEHVMAVNSPRIRMCLDTGHAHTTLNGRTPAGAGGVAVALRVCTPALGYIHVHDNNGTRDAHVMPGRGAADDGVGIDWLAFGAALRESGCGAIRMLEVFEDPALSGAASGLSANLREWLDL